VTKDDLRVALDRAVDTITEMGIRFAEVTQRLDRMDATLNNHTNAALGQQPLASPV